MELSDINKMERASNHYRAELMRIGIALLFVAGIMIYVGSQWGHLTNGYLLVVAGMIGGYMAMNIGANDVANNVGPAVGSKALTLVGAIVIAAVFEASGAIIAGGEVISTIKKVIIDPVVIVDPDTFIWVMMGALLAGAIWLNAATALGAPVSTTHSIVGGVLGAGIAAGGWDIANWGKMGSIAASWVISPVAGGVIAALFLFTIKRTITYKGDKIAAAKKVVPILIGVMALAFSTYICLKGIKKLVKIDFPTALAIGTFIGVVVTVLVKPLIARAADKLENSKDSINNLFTIPLIFAAALLSFAHGANDVANAIGPLAAINDSILHASVSAKASIPLWIMLVGAIGIAVGLSLYGPKLIKTVGSEITELNKIRAFCVAMAAAITVIIATQLGLPVSSTHIAVGGIFGVGFLREFIKSNHARMVEEIVQHHQGRDEAEVEAFLNRFNEASLDVKEEMLLSIKKHTAKADLSKRERKGLKKIYSEELVKRSALLKIAAAWVITVPVSGLLGAMFFFTIRGVMLP